jgi:cell wall-associated NlpC family hydrolase
MKLGKTIFALVLCFCATTSFAAKVVLGKLGQTIKATTIRSAPNTRSRVYYRSKAYEYLVLRPSQSKSWFRVLLQNGMFGYVQVDAVASLPYEVTSEPPKDPRMAFPGSENMDARSQLAQYSLKFRGTPYKWGGTDPRNGIDCSGFVQKLYGAIGLGLPRTAASQANVGQPITKLEDLRPGDRLYFWSASRKKIGHTGMYIGRGYFVHSSSGRHGVATDYLLSKKWLKTLVAARR